MSAKPQHPQRVDCSELTYRSMWGSEPCQRPATLTVNGKPYCSSHDPDRKKKREASKCYHYIYGRLCGGEAVEVDSFGYGRCAKHTESQLDYEERLRRIAPELVEACRAALKALESPEVQKVLVWTGQREALRNVLMKLEKKEKT